MSDINTGQEQFRQADETVAHEAAISLEQAIADPTSPILSDIYHDQERLTAYLDGAEREIKRKHFDALLEHLGVYSRGGIEALAIREALRMKGNRADAAPGMLILSVDIDGLKQVNDALGRHSVGDALIVSVASALKRVLRETDEIGRIGGDEMIALLPISTHELAEVIMTTRRFNGYGDARVGIFEEFKQLLEQSRKKFIIQYGEKWPQGAEQKRPGQASIGWHFFSRDEYLQRFEEYLQSEEKGKLFTQMLITEADEKMYEMKRGTTPTPSPDVPPETPAS